MRIVAALILSLIAPTLLWAEEPLATVVLLAGHAERHPADPTQVPHSLREGETLREGDRIRVANQSLVILRFADNLRLSLRPGSDLTIRRYHPAGAQHLELNDGSVRIVTGEGAKADPERFRLATPIAAIGVRGTDFSAALTPDALYTQLHAGAILIAPTAQCADNLTTCPHLRRIDVPGDLLRITPDGQLLPAAAQIAARANPSRPTPTASPTAAATSLTATQSAAPSGPSDEPARLLPPKQQTDAHQPLIWTYWAHLPGPRLPNDTLSRPLTETANTGYTVVLGDGAYGLWRAGPDLLDPTLAGRLTFQLTAAAVGFTTSELHPPQPAGIESPQLTADLSAARLTAAYTLIDPEGHRYPLTTDLTLRPNATAITPDNGRTASAALTSDGRYAALRFLHPVAAGQFEGITLWRR